MQGWFLFLEGGTVPLRQRRSGVISTLREFVLPYEDVRRAQSPDDAVLEFAQSTYDAASTLATWDRAAFEEKKPALHSARQYS